MEEKRLEMIGEVHSKGKGGDLREKERKTEGVQKK
jgi:hypothetical protein